MRYFALVAAVLFLAACPKRVEPPTVTGTDDEQVDQYMSKLEELRTRMQSAENECPANACQLAKESCEISSNVCAIAGRNADRADFQGECGKSQEDCARFNDTCARCQ